MILHTNKWCVLISDHNLSIFLAATKQLYKWYFPSVRPSVRLSVRLSVTPFWLCSHHRIVVKLSGVIISDQSKVHAKGHCHIAWCCLEEVPYYFSRPSVKFQGHTAIKIVEFDPNWPFPTSNSSLNTPMATKWCTKLEVALKRCPIGFQGHPSNFKVTRLK